MHIVGFVIGTCVIAAGVAVAAVAMGFSGWTSFGLATASFLLAQLLYLAWVAAMAQIEARRRKLQGPKADSPAAKPTQSVVQKG